ncbi:MAG: hypothetical protein ACRDDY_04295 [Clostridium sp.]|uniref:hypothetical protein n=1 Tax=Clostridium sp. TaxID=1506 RepID=UPI003EE4CD5D
MEEKRIEIINRFASVIEDDDSVDGVINALISLLGGYSLKLDVEKIEICTKSNKLTFLVENLNKKGVKLC